MQLGDLDVQPISSALAGKTLDVVVTGSIAAVSSIKFIRSLRRLGATVHPWLSPGARQFITPMAVEWAASSPALLDFSGTTSHLAAADACVIAPASANFIRKLSAGITDSATSALAASYLGAKKPVIVLPTMHESLSLSPAISENLRRLHQWCTVLGGLREEGKIKFPDPVNLADAVAHHINRRKEKILVAFGGTRASIDDVRYITNSSTGKLGTQTILELYRHGFQIVALRGDCKIRNEIPEDMTVQDVPTFPEMQHVALAACQDGVDGIIFMPAILDFVPEKTLAGKIASSNEPLNLKLIPTEKILPHLNAKSRFKIGFKLYAEPAWITDSKKASQFMQQNKLTHLILNHTQQISSSQHQALCINQSGDKVELSSKLSIAKHLSLLALQHFSSDR